MSFRNFLISTIKSLIVIVVATLLFSTVTLELPDLIKGVFGDIFAYASPEVQKQVVSKLAEACSSLEQGENLVSMVQICINQSLLNSMRENCQNYRELKRRNVKIEDEQKVRETCQQIESGELERVCNEFNQKSSLLLDFSKIGALCNDYRTGKINDKEFFFKIISGAIPSQMQMPNIGVLDKYNQFIAYLNNNKVLYFVILLILIIILYLLTIDIKLFLLILSQISFSIGILIMLPYFAISVYDKFIGIDTTPLLGMMFGAGSEIEPKAIISVILLLFLKTYNNLMITFGIVLLAIGVAGKVYRYIFKREVIAKETIKEVKIKRNVKKMDELFGELKQSMKKKKKNN